MFNNNWGIKWRYLRKFLTYNGVLTADVQDGFPGQRLKRCFSLEMEHKSMNPMQKNDISYQTHKRTLKLFV